MIETRDNRDAPFTFEYFDSLGSTNDEAMRRAAAGNRTGYIWIVADQQTSGRGRLGRVWTSPPGNLYASLLLINPSPLELAPELGFVAGVALAKALRNLDSKAEALRLKWPNDLVDRQGAKLSGLLLESSRLNDGALACVIGFGVNCAVAPEGLPYPTQSLAGLGMADMGPRLVLATLSREMGQSLALWNRGRNFAAICESWQAMAYGLEENLRVVTPAHQTEGRFLGLDDHGRLILATLKGEARIEAGDVFPGHWTEKQKDE